MYMPPTVGPLGKTGRTLPGLHCPLPPPADAGAAGAVAVAAVAVAGAGAGAGAVAIVVSVAVAVPDKVNYDQLTINIRSTY